MPTPLSLWISAKWARPCTLTGWSLCLCFYTGTADSRVQPTPRYSGCESVCVTRSPGRGGRGPVEFTHCLTVHIVLWVDSWKHHTKAQDTLQDFSNWFYPRFTGRPCPQQPVQKSVSVWGKHTRPNPTSVSITQTLLSWPYTYVANSQWEWAGGYVWERCIQLVCLTNRVICDPWSSTVVTYVVLSLSVVKNNLLKPVGHQLYDQVFSNWKGL